jgi:serine phosphatase RsbU (regulator of sigma subunit)
MAPKSNLKGLADRLADFAARFDEETRKRFREWEPSHPSGFFPTAWCNLHDLFTRDVTREALKNLIKHETTDTIRFFTREIDFASLRLLPWHKRYPLMLWRSFRAMAYRLSPPRRIAFVLAAFAFLAGCVRFVSLSGEPGGTTLRFLPAGAGLWLFAIAVLALLLLMELRDKLDLKGDLEIAREIQFGLVPSAPYERDDFALHHFMRPANTVGGDYYDIIELSEGGIAVAVGDVAGKGMPAALLMALLQGSLRTLLTAGLRGTELISKLNDYLCDNIPPNRLVTFFYGELDTAHGALRYVNAGHNAPLLITGDGDRKVERLPATSVVLGFMRSCEFEAAVTRLEPGSRLVLYTDGIVEALNAAGEEYGEGRLEQFLKAHTNLAYPDLIKGLIEDVLAFCAGSRPGDDMTLMIVGRSRQPAQDAASA